ncbi:hypothetical protein ACJ2A9_22730 [Anaerobacillus sp. MEB173]|uniref:hypothetical protein n=1 Tax=Anaerobacillus sp. MEB173 TaxID=3383345 RepID=UPI003F8F35AA
MKKLTKREKTLLAIFCIFLFIVVGINYWLLPTLDKIDNYKLERADLIMEWENIEFYVGREEEIESNISELEGEIEELLQQLPPKQQSHLYWEQLLNLASEAVVSVELLQEANIDSAMMSVEIRVDGTYPALKTYIGLLETMPYMLSVLQGSFHLEGDHVVASLALQYSNHSILSRERTDVDQIVSNSSRNPFEVGQ